MLRCSPVSTLFPYTTLFRSQALARGGGHLAGQRRGCVLALRRVPVRPAAAGGGSDRERDPGQRAAGHRQHRDRLDRARGLRDRKSTRLNSSHLVISYAVFCLNATLLTGIYALSLHDALPISSPGTWWRTSGWPTSWVCPCSSSSTCSSCRCRRRLRPRA